VKMAVAVDRFALQVGTCLGRIIAVLACSPLRSSSWEACLTARVGVLPQALLRLHALVPALVFYLLPIVIPFMSPDGAHSTQACPFPQLRYQWWREGVAAAFRGDPPRHPVLTALQAVVAAQRPASGGVEADESHQPEQQGCSTIGHAPDAAGSAGPAHKAVSSQPSLRQYHLKVCDPASHILTAQTILLTWALAPCGP
jgi:hypothetical protein